MRATVRSENLIAKALEERRGDAADLRVVVDEQDSFTRAFRYIEDGRLFGTHRRLGEGQHDVNGGSNADFAVDGDTASTLQHDPEHRRQTKAAAPTDLLGREEGLEDLFAMLERNAVAGVPNRELCVATRRE